MKTQLRILKPGDEERPIIARVVIMRDLFKGDSLDTAGMMNLPRYEFTKSNQEKKGRLFKGKGSN